MKHRSSKIRCDGVRKTIPFLIALLFTSCVSQMNVSGGTETKPQPGVQNTCPVMDGKEINSHLYVDYQGFRIYVCCNACVKAVRKSPEKYLKKMLDHGTTLARVGPAPL